MIKFYKLLISSILIITMISCGNTKTITSKLDINTKPNRKYNKSKKAFYGKLERSEYLGMMNLLEKELNTMLSRSKAILINYNQKASNCIAMGSDESSILQVIDNGIRISSRIRKNYNVADFFVYENDSYRKKLFKTRTNYKQDTGFFYNNIFTLHENCEAFYILKPNGNFMKYYGEDYYSEVTKFLEEK